MVVPCRSESSLRGAGQDEKDFFRSANFADPMKRDAAILSRDLRRLLGRNGEEEFVIFATMECEIQGIGGAQRKVGRRNGDSLCTKACAHLTGFTETGQICRKSIAQIDECGGQISLDKKLA